MVKPKANKTEPTVAAKNKTSATKTTGQNPKTHRLNPATEAAVGAEGTPSEQGPKLEPESLADSAIPSIGAVKSQSGIDLTEKVKELLRLAQEQGYLTYNDINDALPDSVVRGEVGSGCRILLRLQRRRVVRRLRRGAGRAA